MALPKKISELSSMTALKEVITVIASQSSGARPMQHRLPITFTAIIAAAAAAIGRISTKAANLKRKTIVKNINAENISTGVSPFGFLFTLLF